MPLHQEEVLGDEMLRDKVNTCKDNDSVKHNVSTALVIIITFTV